jgi:hypothetical protein
MIGQAHMLVSARSSGFNSSSTHESKEIEVK